VAETSGEKKHDASPMRRERARNEGQIPRSQDLVSALVLMAAVLTLMSIGPGMLRTLASLVVHSIESAVTINRSQEQVLASLKGSFEYAGLGVAPLLVAVLLASLLANLGMTGWLFLPDKLAADFSRINPVQGFKRLFSLQNVMRLVFGLSKIAVLTAVVLLALSGQWSVLLSISGVSLLTLGQFLWETTMRVGLQASVVLLVLALAEYSFQRWKHEQDIKMTDEEIREELKSTQGDPLLKARRRRVQRELAGQRLQQEVPKADVVITNPTEFAVALRYDPQSMAAPIVLAKGADAMAATIRRIALDNGIPVLERKVLARALFHDVEVGQPIPAKEYAAVAEVLRYVYEIQGRPLPTL
jgi:flagellar biosynthesis protein FlhB